MPDAVEGRPERVGLARPDPQGAVDSRSVVPACPSTVRGTGEVCAGSSAAVTRIFALASMMWWVFQERYTLARPAGVRPDRPGPGADGAGQGAGPGDDGALGPAARPPPARRRRPGRLHRGVDGRACAPRRPRRGRAWPARSCSRLPGVHDVRLEDPGARPVPDGAAAIRAAPPGSPATGRGQGGARDPDRTAAAHPAGARARARAPAGSRTDADTRRTRPGPADPAPPPGAEPRSTTPMSSHRRQVRGPAGAMALSDHYAGDPPASEEVTRVLARAVEALDAEGVAVPRHGRAGGRRLRPAPDDRGHRPLREARGRHPRPRRPSPPPGARSRRPTRCGSTRRGWTASSST